MLFLVSESFVVIGILYPYFLYKVAFLTSVRSSDETFFYSLFFFRSQEIGRKSFTPNDVFGIGAAPVA